MKLIIRLSFLMLLTLVVAACSSSSSQVISPDNYVSQFMDSDTEHILIDVRTAEEFAEGHIAGAVNIPVDYIEGRLAEIPTDIPVVVYCRSGNRSARAASILVDNGYSEIYDLGGIMAWTNAGYPVE